MSITINNLYRKTLYQVMLLEKERCDISQDILQMKNHKEQQKLMISFLCLDLKKHQLLAYASQVAVQLGDHNVINRLKNLYCHVNKSDSILKIIQYEIDKTCQLISTMQKSLQSPADMTFSEKRLTQEIKKYIFARAQYQQK